jgi:hypothetical protein
MEKMTGLEALAMTLALIDDGMDPGEATDLAIDTMTEINAMTADENVLAETIAA